MNNMDLGAPDYNPKEVVQELMTFLRDEKRDIKVNNTVVRANVVYSVYKCPRGDLCRNQNAEVAFQKCSGFTNPLDHLTGCYKKRPELNAEIRDRRSMRPINRFFLTERERAMFAFVQLVVLRNIPVSAVEDTLYRDFSKFNVSICRKTFKEVLFNLVELVENKITAEMNTTKGAIMYDGWTHGGMHYLGLFAIYMKRNDSTPAEQIVAAPLLSVSPMAMNCQCNSGICTCSDETNTFDGKTHAEQIRSIFMDIFKIDSVEWIICQIADNTNLNPCIADWLHIPHIGCASHKLNLQVEAMVESDKDLESCLKSVHDTMMDVRGGLRNRAMLRNLTALCPIVDSKTRWSGKCNMLQRFCRVYDDLKAVAKHESSSIVMDLTTAFKANVTRFSEQLAEINFVTKLLQTKNLSLSECRMAMDSLSYVVHSEKTKLNSKLFKCKLGTSYISSTSHLVKHKAFENGVVKIQRDDLFSLTLSERSACKRLLIEPSETSVQNQAVPSNVLGEIYKRRKVLRTAPKYMDTRFIIGSVAEVERLWSLAKNVLSDNRKLCTPMLAEAILFLKVNSQYWDDALVATAMRKTRSDMVNSQLLNDSEVEEGMAGLVD